jgi:hypothetical protein
METNLYDKTGRAKAYIADDSETIYLWSGKAVAYIIDENVYGWKGKHIGWFVNGKLFDRRGKRIGFIPGNCPVATCAAPAKYAKHAKYAKSARHAAYARVALSTSNSEQELEAFLSQNAPGI